MEKQFLGIIYPFNEFLKNSLEARTPHHFHWSRAHFGLFSYFCAKSFIKALQKDL
jgi:hypothetical protein